MGCLGNRASISLALTEVSLAQVLIRNLDPGVVERLKERARRRHRSLQAELTIILEHAAAPEPIEFRDLTAELRRRLGGRKHTDSAKLLAEDRGR